MKDKDFVIENGVLDEYNGNESDVVIPNSVKRIGECAFYNCRNLTSIKIPSIVTSIDYCAFEECRNLSSINIPDSLTWIGRGAFRSCYNLTKIKIPSSVTFIGEDAFLRIKTIKRPHPIDGKLIAYKAFNKDWTCRGFKYEIGKSYHQDGLIFCCYNGFHACLNPLDIFIYYYGYLSELHFAEVELSGKTHESKNGHDTKVAASDIRIIRELTATELAEIYNNMEKEYER